MIKNTADWLYSGYIVTTGIIVYLGAYFFALHVVMLTFLSDFSSDTIRNVTIIIGVAGAIVNAFLYISLKKPYHLWSFIRRNRLDGRAGFFLPPVVTFAMAGALSVYVFGFISEGYAAVWTEARDYLPTMIEQYAAQSSGFVLLFLFGIVYLLLASRIMSVVNRVVGEKKVVTYIAQIFIAIFCVAVLMVVLTAVLGMFGERINSLGLNTIMSSLFFYLLGALPLYWIYELFVAPFYRKTERIENKVGRIIHVLRKMNNMGRT